MLVFSAEKCSFSGVINTIFMKKLLFLSCTLFSLFLHAQQEPLRVFDSYRGGGASWVQYQHLDHAWYGHLHQLADQYLGQRKAEVESCDQLPVWEARKKKLRENLLTSIGGLPAKTPLRARTVATLDRPSFTVEKIIYESLPQFYVTACLFLPKNTTAPAPAVIYCSGHADAAFRSPVYQRVIINLVEKGFVVLAFDPIGQGERYQYLDDEGQPNIGGPTTEHSYAGLQCLINGESVARYMIHDGIRAVDYLLTRPEVDPKRIGITGRSGGGTQSAYIAAFDDRIHAVAPENYITTFRRIWAAIGPQDAEQNFLSAHKLGLDHGDLLSVRAPKPALMLTTTRDYFSIQGARETYREVKDIYRLYGAEMEFGFAEDDYQHGSTAANREAMNAFFQRALSQPGDPTDQEVQIFDPEELQVTETGQVVSALNSRTVFDLNQEDLKMIPAYNLRDPYHLAAMKTKIREITGIEAPPPYETAVFTGRIQRNGYTIEKYFLEFENERYPLPFVWVSQSGEKSKPLVLYLHSEGKETAMQSGGEIEQLVRAGYDVLAPDLLNVGELAATSFRGDSHIEGVSFNLILGSSLVGKSLPALQTEDLMAIMDFIGRERGEGASEITVLADGQYALPVAHYAALESPFAQLVLRRPPAAWRDLLQTERYLPALAYTVVPGALPYYDWPDLLAMGASGKLLLTEPQNAYGAVLGIQGIDQFYPKLKKNAGETATIQGTIQDKAMDMTGILQWLKK